MTRWTTYVLTCLTAVVATHGNQGLPGASVSQPPSEMVQIDGSKNPEMIPQWAAWELALDALNGSSDVPTVLYDARVSKEEKELIKREARADAHRDGLCKARMAKLAATLGRSSAAEINRRTREIQLDCRQQILDIRDRLLASIRPEVQLALTQWVESLKSGIQIAIARRELAHFRKPQ